MLDWICVLCSVINPTGWLPYRLLNWSTFWTYAVVLRTRRVLGYTHPSIHISRLGNTCKSVLETALTIKCEPIMASRPTMKFKSVLETAQTITCESIMASRPTMKCKSVLETALTITCESVMASRQQWNLNQYWKLHKQLHVNQ